MLIGKISFSNSNNLLSSLSKIFALLSFCLIVFIAIKMLAIKKQLSLSQKESSNTISTQTIEKILPTNPPFSQYAEAVAGRNLFKISKATKRIIPKATQKTQSTEDLTKNIKILGVMLTKTPQVILQNLHTHETIVLSIGDKTDDLTLTDIQKDKIIFERQGQQVQVTP